jgi:hydrogenase nickel incorporation protein HypA/HybF
MQAAGATRLTKVQLVLGASGHLTEDAARQHFALCAQNTPAADAQLDITWEPAAYQCFECLARFASLEPPETVRCPECGGLALEVAHSDACYIAEIQVEDGIECDGDGAGERLPAGQEGGESCA